MDNSIALLIIIKKEVNIGAFITWCSHFGCLPNYDDYTDNDVFDYDVITYNGRTYQSRDRLGNHNLTQFEFNYLVTFLNCLGYIGYE